jgi:Fis family transcriptional regulator
VTNQPEGDALAACVRRAMKKYFRDLEGEEPERLHALVLGEVEAPLLEVVLNQVEGNQAKAARWLGIDRNTLRKKLKQYRLA